MIGKQAQIDDENFVSFVRGIPRLPQTIPHLLKSNSDEFREKLNQITLNESEQYASTPQVSPTGRSYSAYLRGQPLQGFP